MGLNKRIQALMDKIEPDRAPAMRALFDDLHWEDVPKDEVPSIWALRRAMSPEGPRVLLFESEEDPLAAKDETDFLHCLTHSGADLSRLWAEDPVPELEEVAADGEQNTDELILPAPPEAAPD